MSTRKLDPTQETKAVKLLALGMSQADVARRFSCARRTIWELAQKYFTKPLDGSVS